MLREAHTQHMSCMQILQEAGNDLESSHSLLYMRTLISEVADRTALMFKETFTLAVDQHFCGTMTKSDHKTTH